MKCPVARTWIMLTEVEEELPRSVARHLDKCSRCRKRQQRLNTLHQQVAAAPIPSLTPDLRARLAAELEKLPGPAQVQATLPFTPTVLPPRLPYLRVAALILFSFTLGWFATNLQSGKQNPTIPSSDQSGDELLANDLLKWNRQLIGSGDAEARSLVLLDIAKALSGRSTKAARDGAVADIPLFVDLHRRVIRLGVLPQIGKIPESKRDSLVKMATEHCFTVESEIHDIIDHNENGKFADPPLRPLLATVQKAKELLANNAPWPIDQNTPLPDSAGPWQTLLNVLVMQALRLADEQDPVRREGYGNQLVAIEQGLHRISGAFDVLKQERQAALTQPGPLSLSEQKRVEELENNLTRIQGELARMKGPPVGIRPAMKTEKSGKESINKATKDRPNSPP